VRISEQTAEDLLQYALMLNTDFVWIHAAATVLESTLAHTLNSRDVKTLVVEMGVGMRITEDYCTQLVGGILHLLFNLGMWEGEVPPTRTPIVSKDHNVSFVNSDAAGIFIPSASHGGYVSAGDNLGTVYDPLTGNIAETVLAPCEGLVFTLREYPVVFGGSLLARILEYDKNA
jgi:predicted deacylase